MASDSLKIVDMRRQVIKINPPEKFEMQIMLLIRLKALLVLVVRTCEWNRKKVVDLENDKQVEAALNMTLGWPYCVQSVFMIKGMFKRSMSISSGKRFYRHWSLKAASKRQSIHMIVTWMMKQLEHEIGYIWGPTGREVPGPQMSLPSAFSETVPIVNM